MEGWIKLHRNIMEHWLYNSNEPFTRREAWIHLLLTVNHKYDEVPVGDQVFICNRGQSVRSLDTYAKNFNWDKSRVRRFFKLLEKQNMIETENLKVTTRITICNYDTYQGQRNTDETQKSQKRNKNETVVTPNKNVKNEKEEKKINSVIPFKNINGNELYTEL